MEEKVAAPVSKVNDTAVGIRHADHVALYAQKLALSSPSGSGSSVGIVRSQTQATVFVGGERNTVVTCTGSRIL
jgi:hypothetical protein